MPPSPLGGLTRLIEHTRRSLVRFPVSIASATAATIFFIGFVHSRQAYGAGLADFRNGIIALVGISVGALATLWGENRKLPRSVNLLITCALTICLWLVGIFWKRFPDLEFSARMLQLALVVHLGIAYLPAARWSQNAFWQYNRFLFRRMIVIGIYAGVICVGLICAVQGARYLLDVPFKDTVVPDIFFFCFCLYHPCVALGGMPEKLEQFEEEHGYPQEIAVFTKFILLPLVALYGLILYLYLAKILLSWELPRGGVGYLVSTVSLLGILCFLLLEPVISTPGNRMQRLRSVFFFLMFPLIFLLFLGLKVRIGRYGFTPHRFLLVVYGTWFTAIAIYFLSSKVRNIKFIPSTLAVLAFLSLVGPWSAYQLPAWLQFRSLQAMLMQQGLWRDGRAVKGDKVPNPELTGEIRSKLQYLLETRERKHVLSWFLPENEVELEMRGEAREGFKGYLLVDKFALSMGLEKTPPVRTAHFFSHYDERYRPLSVKGYSTLLDSYSFQSSSSHRFRLEPAGTSILLTNAGKTVAVFELKSYVEEDQKELGKRRERIEIPSKGELTAKLIVHSFEATWKDGKPVLDRINAEVLLR